MVDVFGAVVTVNPLGGDGIVQLDATLDSNESPPRLTAIILNWNSVPEDKPGNMK